MKKWGLLLGAGLAMSWPATAEANVGIAFVHGTGHATNALDDYWGREFVDTVRMGLPDPSSYTVVNCDFQRKLWAEESTGCLAEELGGFIDAYDVDELIVVTHSHGANMMRWILSNPTYDARYPKIIESVVWVDSLAPSSLGTPLADAALNGNKFETSLGWLLGYENDAVEQQRPANMASLNANWLYGTPGRPQLPAPLWSIVGTAVETNVFDGDSYCGGYHLNLGLEVTANWLDDCSDGFIECSSAAGAGKVWAYDHQFTEGSEPLNHNQSRRACFGLPEVLRAGVETL